MKQKPVDLWAGGTDHSHSRVGNIGLQGVRLDAFFIMYRDVVSLHPFKEFLQLHTRRIALTRGLYGSTS